MLYPIILMVSHGYIRISDSLSPSFGWARSIILRLKYIRHIGKCPAVSCFTKPSDIYHHRIRPVNSTKLAILVYNHKSRNQDIIELPWTVPIFSS